MSWSDEITFAGSVYNTYNLSTYLQENATDFDWWSLSPSFFRGSYAGVWYVDSGLLGNGRVNNGRDLRPVISLISSTNVTGDGTSENPFIVEK